MGKVKIGLKQAQRLAKLSQAKRLAFLAEGMPLIRDSAFGFWSAAQSLPEHPREREVLEGFAEEEAAKGLILMDIVRCPLSLHSQRMGPMIGWFYSHLARLLYAKAATWRPVNTKQLQIYLDDCRQSHDIDGSMGEYIVPNWELYRRESQLYVDIAAFESDEPVWSAPLYYERPSIGDRTPPALQVLDAFHNLGITTEQGLHATSEIWEAVNFHENEGYGEVEALIGKLIDRVMAEKLPLETATPDHRMTLYQFWQIPMYSLELGQINISIDDLHRHQDKIYFDELGY